MWPALLSKKQMVVAGVISLIARRLAIPEDHPEVEVQRTCETLMSAYLATEPWKPSNATDAWSRLLEEVVGTACVPGTIAATAARAFALAAWWSKQELVEEPVYPSWATIQRPEGPWTKRLFEGAAVKFVRSLLRSHDVVQVELKPEVAAARIRHLRRTTEALGFVQNLVAPVLVKGRFGLRDGVVVRRETGVHKDTRCVWFEPVGCDHSRGTLIYLHGGGFLIGSAVTNGEMVARIADAVKLPTLLVEYRKSPEAQFPEALIDALRAVRYVILMQEKMMKPSSPRRPRIVLGGDSAGGTLAFATLLALRRVDVFPKCVFLLSPLVDLDATYSSKSYPDDILPAGLDDESDLDEGDSKPTIRDFYGRMPSKKKGFTAWRDASLLSPKAASRRELARIAETPLCVHVGGKELLCDSICTWADKAKAAGATVDLTVFPDEVHAFHAFGFAPAWDHAKTDLRNFVNKHLDDDDDVPLTSSSSDGVFDDDDNEDEDVLQPEQRPEKRRPSPIQAIATKVRSFADDIRSLKGRKIIFFTTRP